MARLGEDVDSLAERTGFSGVVHLQTNGRVELAKAYGMADRAHGIANTVDTQFAIASGAKALTALAVVSLVDEGLLDLATTARSVLGDDLPLISERDEERCGTGNRGVGGIDVSRAVPVVATEEFLGGRGRAFGGGGS